MCPPVDSGRADASLVESAGHLFEVKRHYCGYESPISRILKHG